MDIHKRPWRDEHDPEHSEKIHNVNRQNMPIMIAKHILRVDQGKPMTFHKHEVYRFTVYFRSFDLENPWIDIKNQGHLQMTKDIQKHFVMLTGKICQ